MCPPRLLRQVATPDVNRRQFLKLGLGATAAAATTALAAPAAPTHAQGTPFLPGGFSNVQDLTHVFGTAMPLFPGSPPVRIEPFVTIEENGYYGNVLTYWEHCGTHMDAPAHFAAGGLFVDQLPPEQLVVPAVVIDISARAAVDADSEVTVDDLLAWEQQYGRIPANAGVLMHSGWAEKFSTPVAFGNADANGVLHFPGFSKAATDFLVAERSVAGIGVDTLSLDYGRSADFAVHNSFLPTNRWGIENLANLSLIPPAGAFLFVGAPKVASGSGGPCRVLAIW